MERSTVHLFVFDTMSDWEYGHAIAGINNPAFQQRPGSFEVKTVGLSLQPVTGMGGLRVTPDLALDALQPQHSAMLVLPGGAAWDGKKNHEAAELAGRFLAGATPVAAICGATAGLARAGLLDAVPHTSNARDYIGATGYRGAAFYRDVPSVRAGNLVTAAAMAPVEFARDIFALLGVYTPAVLAAWFGLYKTGEARYFAALQKAAG